jgi:tryptophan-rich sensory protein
VVYALFIVFLAACFAVGATGALFPPGDWYRRLKKPVWTPPDWLFPVAWTTLYICLAAAGARVAMLPGSGLAMALWSLQIAVNGLWSPVFFGLRKMKVALIIITVLWVSVAATMVALYLQDPIAGYLFAPYLLWVTIASALNASVVRLNPDDSANARAA